MKTLFRGTYALREDVYRSSKELEAEAAVLLARLDTIKQILSSREKANGVPKGRI